MSPYSADKIPQVKGPGRQVYRLVACAGLALLNACLRADYPVMEHRSLADPTAMVSGDRLYVYCSNDDDNPIKGSYVIDSVVCVSTSDMKNWTDHGEVLRAPRDVRWAHHTWAPSAIERDGKVFLYFGNGGADIGVVVGKSPLGPFEDVLGHALVSHQTPGASGEHMWLFDPAAFIDDDGQAYLYFGGNGEDNARVVRLGRDMISLSGGVQGLHVPHFFEASWMHKREGLYYFSYSGNPANGMRIDYLIGKTPTGPFTREGIVGEQPPENSHNNNHASEVFFKGHWYHFYHSRAAALAKGIDGSFRRSLAVDELTYAEDGSIKPVTYTPDGLTQLQGLNGFARIEAETYHRAANIRTEPLREGGLQVIATAERAWLSVCGVELAHDAVRFLARAHFDDADGAIELHEGGESGPLLLCLKPDPKATPNSWVNLACPLVLKAGKHDLTLVLRGTPGRTPRLDWWRLD